jgi:ketosteroid isomerase-like protein
MGFADADREAIRRAGELFVQNAVADPRDDRASAACYEDDAIMLAPGQPPIIGRAAIERFLTSFPPFSDYRLDVAEVFGDGDLAVERGTASMTLRPPGKAPWGSCINYVVVWRRQPDASWRAAREILTPA